MTEAIKNEAYMKGLTQKTAQTGKLFHLRVKQAPQEFIQHNFQQLAPGVIEQFMQTAIVDVLEKNQLTVISELNLERAEKNSQGDITWAATFDVMPDPKDININIPTFNVDPITASEDEIANSIEMLRARHVQWKECQYAAQLANKITIDLRGEMHGNALPEAHADNMEIVLGMDIMMAGFQEQLIGLQPGDKKTFDLAYPADYPDAHLAGKLATFTVIAKAVYHPVLPAVDEKLIKACGVASGKLNDLMKKLKQNLIQHKTIAAKHQLKEKVFDVLLQQNNFVVPQKMLEDEKNRGEHHAPDLRDDPERTVRLSLLVSGLIKKFNLTPDLARIKQCIDEYVSIYKDAERVRQSIYADEHRLAEMQMLALEDQVVEKLLGK